MSPASFAQDLGDCGRVKKVGEQPSVTASKGSSISQGIMSHSHAGYGRDEETKRHTYDRSLSEEANGWQQDQDVREQRSSAAVEDLYISVAMQVILSLRKMLGVGWVGKGGGGGGGVTCREREEI